MKFLVCLLICLSVSLVSGYLGVDVSTAVSVSQFQCINGDFAIMRCFYDNQGDPNCAQNHQNALQAGYFATGAMFIPCFNDTCPSPAVQVKNFEQFRDANHLTFNHYWIVVSEDWPNSQSTSQAAYKQIVDAMNNLQYDFGTFANRTTWMNVMGNGFQYGKNFPLWYSHDNSGETFTDYSPFGGWKEASLKQYHYSAYTCGINCNLDYLPSPVSTSPEVGSSGSPMATDHPHPSATSGASN
eukprot:TRINITY_DN6454_c0_g1_i1.p1 TRINITY_DN6454_c0_g1~~TRINITY_DN6454_c0_g1_i1.p1  ORF type:complete len:241 (-),score=47.87 TRINITY_DN6454_c0_g1_i1:47-769(-)